MFISALVISHGSIGQRHTKILKEKFKIKDLTVCTSKKLNGFNTIKNLYSLKKRPTYIVIASPTSKHFEQLKFIEKNFRGTLVLVEKPLFDTYKKIHIKKIKFLWGII